MIKLAIQVLATATFIMNGNGSIPLVDNTSNVYLNSPVAKQAQKNSFSISQVQKYLALHFLDVEYFSIVSMTLVAIVIGTGRSLKYQNEFSEKEQITIATKELESLDRNFSQTPQSRVIPQYESLEGQEYYYREKYKKLQQEVLQSSQFTKNLNWEIDDWEIDVEVALKILSRSPKNKEEVKQVLRQCDRAINWEVSLPQREYQAKVFDYVEKVYNWAQDVKAYAILSSH